MEEKRNSFGGSLGFVLAAAGSAVGLGNIWRFPFLAAKDGGGLFLVVYIILAVTFGFTLLTTEIAIGRKTKQSPLTAYSKLGVKGSGWIGVIACLVPAIIMPYYSVIGGWVVKYFLVYLKGEGELAADVNEEAGTYFGNFTADRIEPILLMLVFLGIVVLIVCCGVNKGIESSSKVIMPILLISVIAIAIYSLTLSHTGADGVTRTGLDGLKVYIVPDLDGITVGKLFTVFIDALGQLFFSLSIAMGIMVAYGSYVKDDANLVKSINQIEIFDTVVAILAGMMIIPAVVTFLGEDAMASGPSLMFVSLPNIFNQMGKAGNIVGCAFFGMVLFAAVTSAISIMEAVVSSIMDKFNIKRITACIIEGVVALVGAVCVCFGFNIWSFSIKLPNGANAELLTVMDYISNNCFMPVVALATCILFGWVLKPSFIIDEVEKNGEKMGRKKLFTVMLKFVAPVLLLLLLMQTLGVLKLN